MKQRKQGRRTHTVFYVVGILFLLAIVGVWVFSNTHFLRGTFIGGVDCSYLTVDDALNKVQQEAGEYTNKLYFIDETFSNGISSRAFSRDSMMTKMLTDFMELAM